LGLETSRQKARVGRSHENHRRNGKRGILMKRTVYVCLKCGYVTLGYFAWARMVKHLLEHLNISFDQYHRMKRSRKSIGTYSVSIRKFCARARRKKAKPFVHVIEG
jgi:hypothetical protein